MSALAKLMFENLGPWKRGYVCVETSANVRGVGEGGGRHISLCFHTKLTVCRKHTTNHLSTCPSRTCTQLFKCLRNGCVFEQEKTVCD